LFRYGAATKVTTRESVAHRPHDRQLRARAKMALKCEPVEFSGVQARAIARGFGDAVARADIVIHACAILPEHVHLVVARHRHSIQQLVNFLKGSASRQLLREGLHPFVGLRCADGVLPSVWASQYWKVFIDDPEHLSAAVSYVRRNPVKEGMVGQRWWFERPV
jgi:REP element-mobilizing transposase RayT